MLTELVLSNKKIAPSGRNISKRELILNCCFSDFNS